MKNNWNKNEIGKHSGILEGTIKNHQCDPKEDCPECEGDGRCVECDGSGDVDCHICSGSGRCRDCHGVGQSMCIECGGSGRCRVCGGDGKIRCTKCNGSGGYRSQGIWHDCLKCGGYGDAPCPECSSLGRKALRAAFGASANARGTGKCSKCEGTGKITCQTCNGTGNCKSCHGSGKETCSHCHGDRKCPNCDGTGKVTCKRCEGSGFYQTYVMYESHTYVRKWQYFSSEDLEDGMNKASKKTIYKDIYKKWRFRDSVEFDNYESVKKTTNESFNSTEHIQKFENAYEKISNSTRVAYVPYSKSMEINKVPATKIDFTLNNRNYSVCILGDNSVVMCGELPKKLEMYRLSFFKRLKLSFTKNKRHLSYIKLAAYIFQCDGKSCEESQVLNTFISALNYDQEKLLKLKEQLKQYNAEMPYNVFRKEIKPLFSSKKTLTFAWQCMAVDKKLSGQENTLFEDLTKEYKLESGEIDSIKKFASKYSLLRDENLVSEYMNG